MIGNINALVNKARAEEVPVVWVQHSDDGLEQGSDDWRIVDELSPADGEPVVAGTIYIAPGGHHMRVVSRDGAPVIAIDDGPHINFCKPSVDPLFSSAAAMWGSKALAVVLTGIVLAETARRTRPVDAPLPEGVVP